jgi:cell division GTPase FtsZ
VFDSPQFLESDAILVMASSGGGTGSGVIGWMVKTLKERTYKPVFALLVLPFAFEEKGKASYAVINSATCLNTVSKYADAVFLFDNESHRKVKISLAANMRKINEEIALNFYDLCCAGEEKHARYVGSKVIDAGDIKQSLSGISVIGRGQVNLPVFRWSKTDDYRQEIKNSNLVFAALHKAEVNLGVNVDLQNARKILVLVTCPADYLSTTVLEEIFGYFEQKSPKAEIRIGDYPRRDKEISVTLIASEFVKVSRIERLIDQAEGAIENKDDIGREKTTKIELMKEFIDKIPSLD